METPRDWPRTRVDGTTAVIVGAGRGVPPPPEVPWIAETEMLPMIPSESVAVIVITLVEFAFTNTFALQDVVPVAFPKFIRAPAWVFDSHFTDAIALLLVAVPAKATTSAEVSKESPLSRAGEVISTTGGGCSVGASVVIVTVSDAVSPASSVIVKVIELSPRFRAMSFTLQLATGGASPVAPVWEFFQTMLSILLPVPSAVPSISAVSVDTLAAPPTTGSPFTWVIAINGSVTSLPAVEYLTES